MAEHATPLSVRDFSHDASALAVGRRLAVRLRGQPRGLDQRLGCGNELALQRMRGPNALRRAPRDPR